MTSAPQCLLDTRRFLLDHLDIHSGGADDDLDPGEVGIVGDAAHIGGYHCGSDRVKRSGGTITDYSVVESDRDRHGLSDYASALDVGWFEVRVAGKAHNLRSFSIWLVAQCKANTPDTRDIREIIYSPDGRTVKRWDREGRRSSGDGSHLHHTHISFYRDATKANRPQVAVFRRYLVDIGLIEEDTLSWDVKWEGNDGKLYPASTWLRNANIYAAEAKAEATKARLVGEAVLAKLSGDSNEAVLARINEIGTEVLTAVENVDEAVAERLSGADLDTLVQILTAAGVDKQALAQRLTAS
jgi:hypothetical protein